MVDKGDDSLRDSLLSVLDDVVSNKNSFRDSKYHKIDSLRALASTTSDVTELSAIQTALFKEYCGVKIDTALYYARSIASLYSQIPQEKVTDSMRINSKMNIAEAYRYCGKYMDAKVILDSIHTARSLADIRRLSHLYISIYHSMWRNAYEASDKEMYKDSLILYQKQILSFTKPASLNYCISDANIYLLEDKPETARKVLEQAMRKYDHDFNTNAILTSILAQTYEALGDSDKAITFMAYSAISDIRMANRKYTSLQQLAILLYKRGDINRAYNYISCAMDDITSSNARCRLFELAEYLPIITSAYNVKVHHDHIIVMTLLAVVLVFAIVVLVVALFLRNRSRKLEQTRRLLDDKNKLLDSQNILLEENNKRLAVAAEQLNEANHIKEESIGQIFNLCSMYMDKQEQLRSTVGNMLKGGQTKELAKLVDKKSSRSESQKEFMHIFDTIFLSLFPDFKEKFKTLLNDGETLDIKEGELLSPELRIYALVRLGITDSTKIANFLHFSAQTVYNYRLKTRSRIRLPKEDFIRAVQEL